ncbi:MAG: hypothetical protein ACYCSN_15450 [Acidobacteriaceae bacterium]
MGKGLWAFFVFVMAVSIAAAIGYPLVKGLLVRGANAVGLPAVAAYEQQG